MNCFFFLLVLFTAHSVSAAEQTTGAVVFEGVSTFSSAQLFPIYADRLGKAPSTKNRNLLRQRTRDYYASQGYLEPKVVVSVDSETTQIIIVRVEEPKVDDIRIAGGTPKQRASLRERTTPLRSRVPVSKLDIDRFVRALERAERVGLKSRITMVSPGRYRLALTIAPRIEGEITYSAEGSDRLGRNLVGGTVSVYGPGAGLGRIYISGIHTVDSAGYRNIGIGASMPLTDRDHLYADISSSRAVPQDVSTSPSKVYRRLWSRLRLRHELINSETLALALDGSLTLRDYTRERGSDTEVDEQLRMADIGAVAYIYNKAGTSRISVNGNAGLDAAGAKRSGSRANESIDLAFQLVDARYTFWCSLPADLSMKLDVGGQYSGDNLPYSQRFSVGGSRFARAYESGEFSGDSGIGTKLEFRRGFDSDFGITGARWIPYIYYGIAKAYENEAHDSLSAAASGLGLRLQTKNVSAYIEFGKPLTADSEYKNSNTRLTGRVTAYF